MGAWCLCSIWGWHAAGELVDLPGAFAPRAVCKADADIGVAASLPPHGSARRPGFRFERKTAPPRSALPHTVYLNA